ncbi:tetratricopeptide repeat-containing sulfotransferase family protein [Pseudoponticoccus marisrubri]|uniref:Uncharacterized protein n=1 Tax=Pseudoponticoccus marisrubri TaxID=1685382 RepID=A0A0W7WNU9_9RHOB|nr:sulfotransferase family protein [Pseudoponticoccus marisrubri]KUF12183.1 hypothetical protein AVJ23_00135 [Pseudoponticoccus marisrubri]
MAGIDTALARARAHQRQGRLAEARALCRDVLMRFPRNRRAGQLLAGMEVGPPQHLLDQLVALHGRGDSAVATEEAARLLEVYPENFVLWQILGGALMAVDRVSEASRALGQAARLRPDLPEAARNHGVALLAGGALAAAETALDHARDLAPGDPLVLAHLGTLRQRQGRLVEAEESFRAALDRAPEQVEALIGLAYLRMLDGALEEAMALLDRALSLSPGAPVALNNFGVVQQALGRSDEARGLFARAVAAAPRYAEAWRNLAECPGPTDPQVMDRMAQLRTDPATTPEQRSHLCFGLAGQHDRRGEVARAFPLWVEGNALRKAQLGYEIGQDVALFDSLRALAAALPSALAPPARDAPVPIFILGLPRSGTTLVEQILTCHPDVAAGGELEVMNRLVAPFLSGAKKPTAQSHGALRDAYLDQLRGLSDGAPFVTDKMPQNFRYIPLIRAALPEARILHVVRDPRACCWSQFRTFFSGAGLGYANDLDDLVSYHALYRALMADWQARDPGCAHRVDYEALTRAPETQTRALLTHLGLGWHPACLAPQDNARHVLTASMAQVRKPVYAGSSRDWQRYASLIGFAFDALPGGGVS